MIAEENLVLPVKTMPFAQFNKALEASMKLYRSHRVLMTFEPEYALHGHATRHAAEQAAEHAAADAKPIPEGPVSRRYARERAERLKLAAEAPAAEATDDN